MGNPAVSKFLFAGTHPFKNESEEISLNFGDDHRNNFLEKLKDRFEVEGVVMGVLLPTVGNSFFCYQGCELSKTSPMCYFNMRPSARF